jgi:vacuolar-type H+-ATPase subunit I/STV1
MKMNTKTNKLIGELTARCVVMNCDTLHVFFNYSGHVEGFEISYSLGGWNEFTGKKNLCNVYIDRDNSLTKTHELLDKLQAKHDTLYAPENLAATQEANRLAKIAELQNQIEELENKDERFLKQAQGRSVRNNAGE